MFSLSWGVQINSHCFLSIQNPKSEIYFSKVLCWRWGLHPPTTGHFRFCPGLTEAVIVFTRANASSPVAPDLQAQGSLAEEPWEEGLSLVCVIYD